MRKRPFTDATFDYVAGPMRVGDEHPGHPGWQFTGLRDRRGVLLWYKPPGRISRWVRRVALVLYGSLIALGVLAAFVVERSAG